MRLALTKNPNRNADILCDQVRFAKQKLQRVAITQVSIDHYVKGRENGYEFVRWALSKCLMPLHVVLTEVNIDRREAMASLLKRNGYRTADNLNFMKYH
jgi:hypothetical protein